MKTLEFYRLSFKVSQDSLFEILNQLQKPKDLVESGAIEEERNSLRKQLTLGIFIKKLQTLHQDLKLLYPPPKHENQIYSTIRNEEAR